MSSPAIQSGISNGAVSARFQPSSAEGQAHTVARGDTLSAIAQKNGVSLSALIAANPQIKNPDLIYPGDEVSIPSRGDAETTAVAETRSSARSEVNVNDQVRAAQVRGEPSASSAGNNILSSISTTGASARTARQDGLSGGVASSKTMAQTDASRVLKYKDAFNAAGAKYGLPPALCQGAASPTPPSNHVSTVARVPSSSTTPISPLHPAQDAWTMRLHCSKSGAPPPSHPLRIGHFC